MTAVEQAVADTVLARALSDATFATALARALAPHLADHGGTAGGLVDAQAVADALGVSRSTVYDHAADLGGLRLGDGPRARLRFDLHDARRRWTATAPPADDDVTSAPRRRAVRPPGDVTRTGAPLLPYRPAEA